MTISFKCFSNFGDPGPVLIKNYLEGQTLLRPGFVPRSLHAVSALEFPDPGFSRLCSLFQVSDSLPSNDSATGGGLLFLDYGYKAEQDRLRPSAMPDDHQAGLVQH